MSNPYIRGLATAAAISGAHYGIIDQGGDARKVLESVRRTFYQTGLEAADLSDYEEGTFTPTVQGTSTAGSGTYSTQTGRYTKVGRLVTVEIALAWSAHTGTGNMIVVGLPFTAAVTSPAMIVASGLTYPDQLAIRFGASATTLQPVTMSTGAAVAVLAIDTAVTVLQINGSYSV